MENSPAWVDNAAPRSGELLNEKVLKTSITTEPTSTALVCSKQMLRPAGVIVAP